MLSALDRDEVSMWAVVSEPTDRGNRGTSRLSREPGSSDSTFGCISSGPGQIAYVCIF